MSRTATVIFAGVLAVALVASTAIRASEWTWDLPAYVPAPRLPADNPMSAVKVELGRRLFYDRRLSGNGAIACAFCHVQARAFSDGRAVSVGSTGEETARNAPGLANTAWHATYNWSHPAIVSLERQMAIPLFGDDPIEMGVNDANRAEILARLRADPIYPPLFEQSFPAEATPLQVANVFKAISAFQRAIVSFDSRYDHYLQGRGSLTESEERGRLLFFGERAECHHCHGSFSFNDQVVHERSREVEVLFHNTGIYNLDDRGAYPYPNRGVFESSSKPEDMGAFRAPSLRNVEVTGPYMHDGSASTLEAVVDQVLPGGPRDDVGPTGRGWTPQSSDEGPHHAPRSH